MPAPSSSGRFRAARQRGGLGFTEAVGRMKSGSVLRLEYQNGRPAWSLSGGQDLSPETVSLLLATKEIEADGDTLFPNTPAQVWRLRSQ